MEPAKDLYAHRVKKHGMGWFNRLGCVVIALLFLALAFWSVW